MRINFFFPKLFLFLFCAIFIFWWHSATNSNIKRQASYGFDAQNIEIWHWSAGKGLLPYKDVFYPYGLLFYYQESSLVALFGVIILTSVSLGIVLSAFWFFRESVFLAITNASLFILFILRSIGFQTWSRYGISISAAILIPAIIGRKNPIEFFLLGICTGLLFGLVQDQSLYVASIFVFVLLFTWLARRTWSLSSFLRDVVLSCGIFGVGMSVGIFPFILYLQQTQSLQGFLLQFTYLQDIALAAKTPFIPFALSASNSFVFAVLFCCLMGISFVMIVSGRRLTALMTTIGSLVFLLVLLEQKNILRSIDWQITVIAFLLLQLICAWGYHHFFTQEWRKTVVLSLCLFLLVVLYPFRMISSEQLVTHESQSIYTQVLSHLQKFSDFHNKVFSYPGSPIFYQLTGQKPPYFFTSYETTPLWAQQETIAYLQKEEIRYVIYDLRVSAIQDGVPHYARNAAEFSYLLTHFQAEERVGDFLVLHRSDVTDPQTICSIVPENELCLWQKEVNLGQLPASRGAYPQLSKELYVLFSNLPSLNIALEKQPLSSRNQVLTLSFENRDRNTITRVSFLTDHHESINATFNSCRVCVIHLDRIPGFYHSKNIIHINTDGIEPTEIKIFPSVTTDLW